MVHRLMAQERHIRRNVRMDETLCTPNAKNIRAACGIVKKQKMGHMCVKSHYRGTCDDAPYNNSLSGQCSVSHRLHF